MPLSQPADREPMHTRTMTCQGFRRADGMWDIEGHLLDTKSYNFNNEWRGDLEAGQPVHEMWVRLTIDNEFMIRGVEVESDAGPFPECPNITPNFQKLVGASIGPGWSRAIRGRVGGAGGCTHINELLGRLGTVAYQTIYPARYRDARESGKTRTRDPNKRPRLMDTCYAYRSDGEVVQRFYPKFYTGDDAVAAETAE